MRRLVCMIAVVAAMSFAATTVQAGNPANLLFPLDGSWTVVPFSANGAQGNGPAGAGDPLQRNDDDYAQAGTGMPAVPFTFTLYGTGWTGTDIYLNNNGNLSFGAGFSTFTSTGFPVAGFPMVAPFWADVDTRNTASGVAYYKYFGANTLVMTWDNVGYYNAQADKLNTFQVAISDGTNPTMGLGNNVCFSYDDMAWTTGSASGGVGGFGGTPATVGVNHGNGTNFFQIGRFDHEGVDYDGPGGAADGVSFLDGLDTCFNASGLSNAPPFSPDMPTKVTLDVSLGQELHAIYSFIGPEIGQTVTFDSVVDHNGAVPAGLSVVTINGSPGLADLDWVPDAGDIGSYLLTFNFHDSLGATTAQTLRINVIPEPASVLLLLGGLLALRRRR